MSCFFVLNHCFGTVDFWDSCIESFKKFLLTLLVDHLSALSSYEPIQPWLCYFFDTSICSTFFFFLFFSLFWLSSEYLVSWCCSNKIKIVIWFWSLLDIKIFTRAFLFPLRRVYWALGTIFPWARHFSVCPLLQSWF